MKNLDKQQTQVVAGALKRSPLTTLAIGEEGGAVTTLALGEEGGCFTSFKVGEEGGPIYTTLALGEEGGGASVAGGGSALGSF
jgi:hypothetical protein